MHAYLTAIPPIGMQFNYIYNISDVIANYLIHLDSIWVYTQMPVRY